MTFSLTRRSVLQASAGAAAVGGLSACSNNKKEASSSASASGPITLTFSMWSGATAPEFKALAEAFTKANPDIKVELKEYNAEQYDTLLTADLSAKKGPDVIGVKNLFKIFDYVQGKQIADVSDIAAEYKNDENIRISDLEIDGKYYALPFRADSYVVYYNKDLFKKAGVAEPTGEWTWDDYTAIAADLTKKLKEAGSEAKGLFVQAWPGMVQGFALAQTPDASKKKADQSGDLQYLKPFYERALKVQADGLTETYATATTNKLHYRDMFTSQKTAMTPMGTWFMGMLVAAKAAGKVPFEWGIAPAPQIDSSTFGKPVTYGSPTTAAINGALTGARLEAAKKFLKFITGPEGGKAVAAVGVSPAYASKEVVEKLFAADGMPKDELSRKAYSNKEVHLETSLTTNTSKAVQVLKELHSSVMTLATPVDAALKTAEEDMKSQGIAK